MQFNLALIKSLPSQNCSINLSLVTAILIILLSAPLIAAEKITQNHTYELIQTEQPVTWLGARDSAFNRGGYLAVITDQSEQNIIDSLVGTNDSAWIGGTDVVIEDTWVWVTGENWNYTNWHPSHPDTADGLDYAMIYGTLGGQWAARAGRSSSFVVEWECCQDQTGNVNCDPDNQVNLLDITRLIDYLYQSGEPLCCPDEANIDGDSEMEISILDITALIDFLYKGGEPPANCKPPIIPPSDTVIITDQTGKQWNISYGVHFYGMVSSRYNFGLGPFAITPINFPDFISPGEPGYPAPGETFPVLGAELGTEERAYRLRDLRSHEVANDVHDTLEFAAAY